MQIGGHIFGGAQVSTEILDSSVKNSAPKILLNFCLRDVTSLGVLRVTRTAPFDICFHLDCISGDVGCRHKYREKGYRKGHHVLQAVQQVWCPLPGFSVPVVRVAMSMVEVDIYVCSNQRNGFELHV